MSRFRRPASGPWEIFPLTFLGVPLPELRPNLEIVQLRALKERASRCILGGLLQAALLGRLIWGSLFLRLGLLRFLWLIPAWAVLQPCCACALLIQILTHWLDVPAGAWPCSVTTSIPDDRGCGLPAPALLPHGGAVGQALPGKTLPSQCCSMCVHASAGESVGWEGCLSFSRKAFNTVDTQNLSDYKPLCSSYFSSQFWNHIMVFHTKQAVLSKHPRKISFCSGSFRYSYYINFNNNNRLTHCSKIIVGIYCRTSPKAVQLQFYQLMAQPQPADTFTS